MQDDGTGDRVVRLSHAVDAKWSDWECGHELNQLMNLTNMLGLRN